jgi:histidinol-phosphatase
VSAPALGRRWWAERGGGAFADGEPVRVSRVDRLEDACVCVPVELPLPELVGGAWHPRALGDFWAHMLVAEGAVDLAVESVGVSIWDLAAIRVIVEEAGGRFTDFAGKPRIDAGTAISSNGLLHERALRAVASSGASAR